MRTDSRELLAIGIFGRGSRLGARIELLLRPDRVFSPRTSSAGLLASAIALTGLLIANSLAPRWIAFAQQSRLAFEVSSIKPSDPAGCGAYPSIDGLHGRVSMKCVTVKLLAQIAYGVRDFQISGGPAWISSAQFEIIGKSPVAPDNQAADADVNKLTDRQRRTNGERLRALLQTLLEDRFHFAFHHDIKELPVYYLTVGKDGSKLKGGETDPDKPSGGIRTGRGYLAGSQTNIPFLAQALSGIMGRTVVDRTGLAGRYDFELKWLPDQSSAYTPLGGALPSGQADPAPDPSGPTIFTALQEQLGLKLQAARGPVEIIIVDHVEKPDAN